MTGIDSDSIITRQLQMVGYPDANKLESFSTMKSEDFIHICLFVFEKIPETQGRLSKPPTGKSAMFRFATEMVNACVGLGYTEDLRYDNFLYPKGEVTRSILRFLLDKVPRAASKAPVATTTVSQVSQAITAAQTEISDAIKNKVGRKPLAQPLPQMNKSLDKAAVDRLVQISEAPKIAFLGVPIAHNGVPFNVQCGVNGIASLLAQNDREVNVDFEVDQARGKGLMKVAKRAFALALSAVPETKIETTKTAPSVGKVKGRLENVAKFEFNVSDTKVGAHVIAPTAAKKEEGEAKVEEREEKKEEEEKKEPVIVTLTVEEANALKEQLNEEYRAALELYKKLENQLAELEASMESDKEEIERIKSQMGGLLKENELLEAEAEKLSKIAQVSSAKPEEIRQLKKDLVEATSRLLEIATEWEPKRVALVTEYRSLSTTLKNRNQERARLMKKLKKLKKQIEDARQKMTDADASITDLTTAIEERGEDQLPRHHYVEIIFDMIRKVEKQEIEIEKMRNDIRAQHQRMNQTIETVKRTWLLLDEKVYAEAKRKRDNWSRKTYKMAVELLTLFESISEFVEESGKLQAQAMELEAKIERVQDQADPEALARITADLEAVKKELAERQPAPAEEPAEEGEEAGAEEEEA